ncbi:MAG: hypothetical protein WBA16_11790 [Nonlabens sp.]
MTDEKYLEDLREIRSIMSKSTRFISLSGLSGVMAGIYAIIGAVLGHYVITDAYQKGYNESMGKLFTEPWESNPSLKIIFIAANVLVFSIITAIILTSKKASRQNQKIWKQQSIRLTVQFAVPLVIGGIFSLFLLKYGLLSFLAPTMLIFYGMACIMAAPYTLGTVRYLGISCVILGLINMQFLTYGIYFWAAGFGLCHILYGAIMYYKYDRN